MTGPSLDFFVYITTADRITHLQLTVAKIIIKPHQNLDFGGVLVGNKNIPPILNRSKQV